MIIFIVLLFTIPVITINILIYCKNFRSHFIVESFKIPFGSVFKKIHRGIVS